jgi:hypothetical protein
MTRRSPNGCSTEVIDPMGEKTGHVLEMSRKSRFGDGAEIIDAPELARRLGVPVSWVRQRATSPRFVSEQRIPHIRFGRYIRFLWGSPELAGWIEGCTEQ